jgi:hypothetical protein
LIRVSTSDSCFWLSRLASGSPTIVPPPSWIALNMAGLSVAAHRGCWKLFHEMPTLQAVPPAPPLPPGAALPPPPPPVLQAPRASVRAATTANVLRMNLLLLEHDTLCCAIESFADYHPGIGSKG